MTESGGFHDGNDRSKGKKELTWVWKRVIPTLSGA
jgi:hypothetical protein